MYVYTYIISLIGFMLNYIVIYSFEYAQPLYVIVRVSVYHSASILLYASVVCVNVYECMNST